MWGFSGWGASGDGESVPERISDQEKARRKTAAHFCGAESEANTNLDGSEEDNRNFSTVSVHSDNAAAAGAAGVAGKPQVSPQGSKEESSAASAHSSSKTKRRQEKQQQQQRQQHQERKRANQIVPAASASAALSASRALEFEGCALDCYPYTFSPLLLFSSDGYFEQGYSNYNAVAQFFKSCFDNTFVSDADDDVPVNMLDNVLYERKNMLYEELLQFVTDRQMLVVCCIDAHFTAFQVLAGQRLLYYDPMSSGVSLVTGESYKKLCGFLLVKCSYGDSQHMQENKSYYTGNDSNPTRKMLYSLWKDINNLKVESRRLGITWARASLNLDRYLLINDEHNFQHMSTQLTGNTCYFQCYLFAVLCKVGRPSLAKDGSLVLFQNIDALAATTIAMCRFLLEFFVEEQNSDGAVMRPLSNSNFVVDFFRFKHSAYHGKVTRYLRHMQIDVPDYELQYQKTMRYFTLTKTLHAYGKFTLDGAMSSTLNTKSLQPVQGTDDSAYKLASSNYYKYRAANFMFCFNAGIMRDLVSFCEFNSMRKNQLLTFYEQLKSIIGGCATTATSNRYRDYYFMPQFEVGQRELVDVHYYSYLIDICAMGEGEIVQDIVQRVNRFLVDFTFFSTQRRSNYEKILSLKDFTTSKHFDFFLKTFMSVPFFREFVGLGFAEINPREREINSLTQTVFYTNELMQTQSYRMEHEFEKECINQMARSNHRKFEARFPSGQNMTQEYLVRVKIGHGYAYSKYNTLMHFLNVVERYWHNPDLNNIQVFGKDIRSILAISCQKIFFDKNYSGFYYYGVMEPPTQWGSMDLAVASSVNHVVPVVSQVKQGRPDNNLVLTDRVYEFGYLRGILAGMFAAAQGNRLKTDNAVLNLTLLSLMLDFGLYEEHAALLNLPVLRQRHHPSNKRQLQVEIANLIHQFERKNSQDSITRIKMEQLIFEASYKFLVNKDFPLRSHENALIQELNADPAYQQQLLLCKVNMSLCQINKSVEVDYYKVRCNGEYQTIIPRTFSKSMGDYLEEVTKRYTFSERHEMILYDEQPIFDLRPPQPEICLFRVRFDSASAVQSMVKYIEIKNAFRAVDSENRYLVFIADNALFVDVSGTDKVTIRINKIAIEVATIFFNEAISFIPCFKYADSEDIILFSSPNIRYHVDQGGQFCTDYYGMKHELIENISSQELIVDLNDEHVFKKFKLSELLTESKTVVYFPDYLLQVSNRQQLINLLDLALRVRNVSFFILVLFYLRRSSVVLTYIGKEGDVTKIAGPWKEAILYVLGKASDDHYEDVFQRQFFDLDQHEQLPLGEFIEVLCGNFVRYQRQTDDGQYQIVPTVKQKAFLQRIICADECFHFSEVGSGKTKVILPLLCQVFLSNNTAAHTHLARGGHSKDVLIVLVPEHLLPDALAQVFRYCLNLNFRTDYRLFDDIFALLHDSVQLNQEASSKNCRKKVFVTSFNQFKKALTYDTICEKVWPVRERILVVADEVDDFLDRDKLVFNICSNKSNAFDKPTLELYFEISRAAYKAMPCSSDMVASSSNPEYWQQLLDKFRAIQVEIQDASKSINKNFGVFNEQTLRHCATNIAQDIEGYKSLIARPYESVNRAMPGSYYSDVERTIFLTYVVLIEDIAKYDELFQQERKFISFEYWRAHLSHLDYDDIVYGDDRLSELVVKNPNTKDGLTRFLYEIILRRMEIRDKSRSVNSIDVVFNFDCIGFTGTPFIDNYPTFAYLRGHREDEIPNLIDRSFYVYTNDELTSVQFEERFARFQGTNSNVFVEYVSSDFMQELTDELAILEHIFMHEEQRDSSAAALSTSNKGGGQSSCFNVLVDLCGIFKRSSIHDVRDLVLRHYGPDHFHYVYHIDQTDGSDRILGINTDNDVQFDEEFYKFLCETYGANLREKVFFFVDNRNVIGKDVPFQLIYQRRFEQPLFTRSVVLAHDVDDFSKIWQAMGRSRTMSDTRFSIYKSAVPAGMVSDAGLVDIKTQEFTRLLYVRNCDRKMAGNLSSIYQTLISLLNLSRQSFYYCNEIVNTFLDKMEMTIASKLHRHEKELVGRILDSPVPARILEHILQDKFKRSIVPAVTLEPLTAQSIETLLRHIVQHKFEQRTPSGDIHDEYLRLLSGEQQSLMEISYTKQHQKQKQKQQNKNQDTDTMDIFDIRNQLELKIRTDNYYEYCRSPETDVPKIMLNLPIGVPIFSLSYSLGGKRRDVNVYPTLQFLYSHHIMAKYITDEVRQVICDALDDHVAFCDRFLIDTERQLAHSSADEDNDSSLEVGRVVELHGLAKVKYNGLQGQIVRAASDGRWGVQLEGTDTTTKPIALKAENLRVVAVSGHAAANISASVTDVVRLLDVKIKRNFVRQNPQYTLAGIREGLYVIGMKDQFNVHDLQGHALRDHIEYIADDHGFVLYDRNTRSAAGNSVDSFGPYFIEQYILMELLSKHEVAQNVLDYYVHHKDKLERSLKSYSETQGQGFICWRFVMNDSSRTSSEVDNAAKKLALHDSAAMAEPPLKKRRNSLEDKSKKGKSDKEA